MSAIGFVAKDGVPTMDGLVRQERKAIVSLTSSEQNLLFQLVS